MLGKLVAVIGIAFLVHCAFCRVISTPEKYNMMKVDLYDCYWLCDKDGSHWLDFLECGIDEVAGGTCGVESRARCDDNVNCDGEGGYAALQCCKFNITALID